MTHDVEAMLRTAVRAGCVQEDDTQGRQAAWELRCPAHWQRYAGCTGCAAPSKRRHKAPLPRRIGCWRGCRSKAAAGGGPDRPGHKHSVRAIIDGPDRRVGFLDAPPLQSGDDRWHIPQDGRRSLLQQLHLTRHRRASPGQVRRVTQPRDMSVQRLTRYRKLVSIISYRVIATILGVNRQTPAKAHCAESDVRTQGPHRKRSVIKNECDIMRALRCRRNE